jgi:hypothetical protein
VGPEDLEIVGRFPGEAIYRMTASRDGHLFISTLSGRVYRSALGGGEPWLLTGELPSSRFGDAPLLTVFPAHKGMFFAIARSRTFRWREGEAIREDTTAMSDRWVDCGDYLTDLQFSSGWARSESEAYAAGYGRVLRFDGHTWTLEPTPLVPIETSACEGGQGNQNMEIGGGTNGDIYAGGADFLRRGPDGRWASVDPPPVGPTSRAYVSGVAELRDGALVAFSVYDSSAQRSHLSFWRLEPQGWRKVATAPRRMSQALYGSGDSGDLAVFWRWDHEQVAIIRGNRVRDVAVRGFDFRGAVAAAGSVFTAGTLNGTAMVARLPF